MILMGRTAGGLRTALSIALEFPKRGLDRLELEKRRNPGANQSLTPEQPVDSGHPRTRAYPILFGQFRDLVIVLYSFLVMASSAPSLHELSNISLVPYYLLIPGYTLSGLLSESRGIVASAFNSVIWSLALLAAIISLQSIVPGSGDLPLSLILPLLSLLFFVFGHFHPQKK